MSVGRRAASMSATNEAVPSASDGSPSLTKMKMRVQLVVKPSPSLRSAISNAKSIALV